MRRIVLLVAALLIAAPQAFAQGPYVGASVGGDITRVSGINSDDAIGSGESVSWSLRVGTPIAERFGVELQFVRPAQMTHDDTPQAIPLGGSLAGLGLAPIFAAEEIFPPIAPIPISITVHSAQRNTTLGTTAWVRQQVTPRFAMVYLGGVAFSRVTRRFSYDVTTGGPILASLTALLPAATETVEYGVGPIVGAEGRIGMTQHLQLVPGIRLQSVSGMWDVRPEVGLNWQF
jgi:hypothetical protein